MQQYNIAEYLNYDELALIADNPDEVDYDNLSESQKERYSDFVEAWWTVQRQHYEHQDQFRQRWKSRWRMRAIKLTLVFD